MEKSDGAYFAIQTTIFRGKPVPEQGMIVGYAAIIDRLSLPMPMVHPVALVGTQRRRYEDHQWMIFTKNYVPEDGQEGNEMVALYKHLVFALKYEGVNLLFYSCLVKHYSEKQLTLLLNIEPTGQYSRRIWFIIEWLLGKELDGKEPLNKKKYIPVIDPKQQFAIAGTKSPRHLVINNLPGTSSFCPLVKKTEKLENYITKKLPDRHKEYVQGIRKDIVHRASSFLLLKDSKASFSIEGENPKSDRAARWGRVIGQAGKRALTKDEFTRLQKMVIENPRFINMGVRKKGGFVGEHDRLSGAPIPDHISANWQDLPKLIEGLIETNKMLIDSDIDAIVAAAVIAFGFVFIHPLEDGNGRIHRYLIHHVLARKKFSQQGIIFPVSASILNHIDVYKDTLEAYSHPLLDFVEWEETKDHNVSVLNDTADYYRFFDATKQTEFLYDCVFETIDVIIPQELDYLARYDTFKKIIDNEFEMPDNLIALLVRFLDQNQGTLSKRAKNNEFRELSNEEVRNIEKYYEEIFLKS